MTTTGADKRRRLFRFLVTATREYAVRCLKNCLKIALGRPTYFDDYNLFFRQYLLHVTGIRKIRTLTCPGLRGEGPVSQALTLMRAIVFARAAGLDYVHTPFSVVAHADRPEEEWNQAWERLFNLGTGEVPCALPRHLTVNYCYNSVELGLVFGWFEKPDQLEQRFRELMPEFRRRFRSNKRPRPAGEFRVAVHMRRGEVSSDDFSVMFTPTEKIIRMTTTVKEVLDCLGIRHRITLYSEATEKEFSEFSIPGTDVTRHRVGYRDQTALVKSGASGHVFSDIEAMPALIELVEADLLIMARSSFSEYAGLISDGIKICESGRKTLGNWIECRPDGTFDISQLAKELAAHAKRGGSGISGQGAGSE